MSMCCALLYLIAKMNENEATADDYQRDTVMDKDMLVCDVDAAVVHLHSHSQKFNVREANASYTLYYELVDIMSCDPH